MSKRIRLGATVLTVLLAACAGPTAVPTTPAPTATAAPATVAPSPTQVASSAPATATAAPSITAAPSPSATPTAPPSASPTTAPTPAAVGGGGKLVIATLLEPEGLQTDRGSLTATANPHAPVIRNVVQSLLSRDVQTGAVAPLLAESWTQPDATTWRFTLRRGVTFHDGSPFDAAAAVTSLTQDYKKEVTNFAGSPATFTAVDEFTLEMKTEEPDPIVPARMTMIPVTSAQQITSDLEGRNQKPIGTGPYQVVSWDKGQQVNLALYKDAWQAAPGMFDTVEWKFRVEPAVRAQMIQRGEADVATELTSDQCNGGAITCRSIVGIGYFMVRPDQYNQDLLGDPRIRKAMIMALDRKEISETFFNNGPVMDNPDPPGSVGYDPNIVGYGYDLEGAKTLVADAKADGVDTTLPVNIKFVGTLKPDDEVAAVLAAAWADIGLNVTGVTGVPVADVGAQFVWRDGKTLLKDMPKNRGDVWLTPNANELLDFSFTAGLFYTCEGILSVYCNEEVDALYDKALPLSGDERHEAFKAMWRRAYDDVAFINMAQTGALWSFSDRIDVPIGVDNILPLWLVGQP